LNVGWNILDRLPRTIEETISFIASGGHTVFYFFVSLMPLTAAAHLACRLGTRQLIVLLSLAVAVIGVLPILSIGLDASYLCQFWNPLNFLPYPFAAILLFRLLSYHENKIPKRIVAIVLGAAILGMLLDWTLYVNVMFFEIAPFAIPAYTRPSLVFLSIAVFAIVLTGAKRKYGCIEFMAANSLAVYCLHPLFVYPSMRLAHGNKIVALALVLALCWATRPVVERFVRKDLIE